MIADQPRPALGGALAGRPVPPAVYAGAHSQPHPIYINEKDSPCAAGPAGIAAGTCLRPTGTSRSHALNRPRLT
jgi:hypothetical protein